MLDAEDSTRNLPLGVSPWILAPLLAVPLLVALRCASSLGRLATSASDTEGISMLRYVAWQFLAEVDLYIPCCWLDCLALNSTRYCAYVVYSLVFLYSASSLLYFSFAENACCS